MIKNKKGLNLFFMLFLAFGLGILAYYVDFYFAPHKIIENYIGQHQFSILKSNSEAEKTTLYIGQSAKYSLQQAIYDLSKNGGFTEVEPDEVLTEETVLPEPANKKCRKFYGYYLWNDADGSNVISCSDSTGINTNFIYLFKNNFNEYITAYTDNIHVDYDYQIQNMYLIGKAIGLLEFPILKDETKPVQKEPVQLEVKTQAGIQKNLVDFTDSQLCAKGQRCQLTKEAFEKIKKAQERVPKGVSLEVYSSYRSEKEQIDLWEGNTPEKYKEKYPDENTRKIYVCYPYGNDVEKRCPHLTGNAVDIRFKGKTKNTMTKEDWALLHKIMTEDKPEDRWIRYAHKPEHFECCGTISYQIAILEGKTAIVIT